MGLSVLTCNRTRKQEHHYVWTRPGTVTGNWIDPIHIHIHIYVQHMLGYTIQFSPPVEDGGSGMSRTGCFWLKTEEDSVLLSRFLNRKSIEPLCDKSEEGSRTWPRSFSHMARIISSDQHVRTQNKPRNIGLDHRDHHVSFITASMWEPCERVRSQLCVCSLLSYYYYVHVCQSL